MSFQVFVKYVTSFQHNDLVIVIKFMKVSIDPIPNLLHCDSLQCWPKCGSSMMQNSYSVFRSCCVMLTVNLVKFLVIQSSLHFQKRRFVSHAICLFQSTTLNTPYFDSKRYS